MSERNGSHAEQESLDRLSDRELIRRFAASGENQAFAMLLSRHARMVFGVCRRILRHHQDAEDAFQATFLILARKAGKVRWQKSLANWVYTTACRVAMNASRKAQKRREATMPSEPVAEDTALDEVARSAACRALDEELNRLPEKYRAPLVLCYLQGKTREQAAEELGLSAVVVKGRLQRGRDELRLRLVRRGIGLSAVGGGLAVSTSAAGANAIESAVFSVPEGLEARTVEAAARLASGEPIGGSISTQAVQLAEGELAMLSSSILKPIAATTLAAALVGISCLLLSTAVLAEKPEQGEPAIGFSTEGQVHDTGVADEDLVHANQFQVVSDSPTEVESSAAAADTPQDAAPEQIDRAQVFIGENFFVAAVTTPLQRRLVGKVFDKDQEAVAYANINGKAFIVPGTGLIDSQSLEFAEVRRALRQIAEHQGDGELRVVINYSPPSEASLQVDNLLRETFAGMGRLAGFSEVGAYANWSNDEKYTWQPPERIAHGEDGPEKNVGTERVEVYAVQTSLSHYLTGGADCYIFLDSPPLDDWDEAYREALRKSLEMLPPDRRRKANVRARIPERVEDSEENSNDELPEYEVLLREIEAIEKALVEEGAVALLQDAGFDEIALNIQKGGNTVQFAYD